MADHEVGKIELVVSKNYKTPDVLTKSDPMVNEEVLNLGCSMYMKQQQMLLEITNTCVARHLQEDYDARVMQLTESHATEVQKLTANNEDLKMSLKSLQAKLTLNFEELIGVAFNNASAQHTKRFEEMKQQLSTTSEEKDKKYSEMVQELRNQLQKNEEQHSKMKEEQENRIKELQDSLSAAQLNESVIKEINHTLQKLGSSATALGQLGEMKLEEFIRDKFSSCQVDRTAKQTAAGDLMMTLGPMRLLIESKNVASMNQEEIQKFWRDIDEMVTRKEANAALFVSWRDTFLFDGKKHFVFHYKNGIPVILISNAQGNPELIRISILTLLSLVENGMTIRDDDGIDSMDEKSKYVLSLFEELYVDYLEYSATLKEERKALKMMTDQLKKREAAFSRVAQKFDEAIKRFPDIKYQSSGRGTNIGKPTLNTQNIDDLLEKIRAYKRNHQGAKVNTKTCEDWGYKAAFLTKHGGLKRILEQAAGVNADEAVTND